MKPTITKITDTFYEINEGMDYGRGIIEPYVDSYLLIGSERALVIDALQFIPDLYDVVRSLTSLPIDVLITHGHIDHAGRSLPEFYEHGCRIYMNLTDYDLLASMVPTTRREFFTDIRGGELFDTGTYCLEALPCSGHTPGSMVFLDRQHQILFSGDCPGSGMIWMWLECSTSVEDFSHSLDYLLHQTEGMDHLLCYGGHRYQSPVPLTRQYLLDGVTVCNGLMDGSLHGEKITFPWHDGIATDYETGCGQFAHFCYDPERILM